MTTNDEQDARAARVMAYVDGELAAEDRAAFEAQLAQDLTLQQAVEREGRLRALLGQTYAPVLDEPVPDRLAALLAPPVVASLDVARARRHRRGGGGLGLAQWGGMAASLVLGALLGPRLLPQTDDTALLQVADGRLVAQGLLAQALDERLSGQGEGGVTPGLSFVAKEGSYCRSFTLDGASAGLACREGGSWQVQSVDRLPATNAPTPQFRTAATSLPPALLQRIDELREGDTLDAAAEREALARGWKR